MTTSGLFCSIWQNSSRATENIMRVFWVQCPFKLLKPATNSVQWGTTLMLHWHLSSLRKSRRSHTALHTWIRIQRIVVVFKLWSHRDYIYGYLQKKKKRNVFMMCVSSWRLFFKVNRFNLSVESVCFSMLKWSELKNHCRIPCWDISRKRFFF